MLNICKRSVIWKVIQVKCPLDKGFHTPPVCETCFCFLHILQTRRKCIHSAGCHSTSLKRSYCRDPHPVSWGTRLWVETSGKSWCSKLWAILYLPYQIFLLALLRKKSLILDQILKNGQKDRQAITEVAPFSPSNNAVSSFACTVSSESGDEINNTNVSAFVLYRQSTLCDRSFLKDAVCLFYATVTPNGIAICLHGLTYSSN